MPYYFFGGPGARGCSLVDAGGSNGGGRVSSSGSSSRNSFARRAGGLGSSGTIPDLRSASFIDPAMVEDSTAKLDRLPTRQPPSPGVSLSG